MVAEAFLPSFGTLGSGGIVAFAFGSVLLMDTDAPGFAIALPVIIGVTSVTAAFFLLIVNMAIKARFRPVVSGREELIDSEATVSEELPGMFRIRLRGELWQVKSEQPLQVGQKVKVVKVEGLLLWVKPTAED